jgi:DNA-binding Lrp family transcriptional regulator
MATPRLPKEVLQEAVDAVVQYRTQNAAAIALNIPRATLQSRLDMAKREGIKARVSGVPMSEDVGKVHRDWTQADCVDELRRVASIDPEKVITRNYFRNYSQISESTWSRYFGSFLEYKRQAGIILSRHAHGMERAIAKHASKDNLREMNEQKAGFEDAYLRPSGKRWQTVLAGSDIHDQLCDPFYRRLFIDTAYRVQPEKIVLDGDIFDLTEFGKYTQDPRKFEVVKRITWVHEFLADLRAVCPNSEVIFVEGNHEFRLIRHLSEATPALMTVLSDLHGMTVPDLLGLTKFEVNYVARMDLAAFNEADIKKELAKNYVILYDALLFHHFPQGKSMGYPGANGHHHKHLVWHDFSPQFGPYEWHQMGCGHVRRASYCAGEQWSNGFLLVHVDTTTKKSQFEYIDTTHDHCMIGGRFYERELDERFAA